MIKRIRSDDRGAWDKPLPIPTFETELEHLLNKYSKENGSNTPDWILAKYLVACLKAWDDMIQVREKWYGREPKEVE